MRYERIEVPFYVSRSVSSITLHVEEEADKACYVEFQALFESNEERRVRMFFHRCLSARLLSAGGEAEASFSIGIHSCPK
jgi:hypothetical protein